MPIQVKDLMYLLSKINPEAHIFFTIFNSTEKGVTQRFLSSEGIDFSSVFSADVPDWGDNCCLINMTEIEGIV